MCWPISQYYNLQHRPEKKEKEYHNLKKKVINDLTQLDFSSKIISDIVLTSFVSFLFCICFAFSSTQYFLHTKIVLHINTGMLLHSYFLV